MNVQSIILLAVILIVASVVLVRYVRRQKRTGGCGSCNCGCENCPSKRKK